MKGVFMWFIALVVPWFLGTAGATLSYYWDKTLVPDPLERERSGRVLRWFWVALPVITLGAFLFHELLGSYIRFGFPVMLMASYLGAAHFCEKVIKKARVVRSREVPFC